MELFCEAYVPCLQGERGGERDYDKGQIERDQVKGKRERGMRIHYDERQRERSVEGERETSGIDQTGLVIQTAIGSMQSIKYP